MSGTSGMLRPLRARVKELFSQGLKHCACCQAVKPLEEFQKALKDGSLTGRTPWCKQCRRKDGKELYERMRLEALRTYSVTPYPSCVCCQETIIQFLGIDHINGGGREHRKEVGSGFSFYRWLKRQDYPEGFQTMCHNCNQAKGQCGTCPHEARR